MSATKIVRIRIKSVVSTVFIVLVLGFLAILVVRLLTGRSLGLRSMVSSTLQSVSSLSRAVTDSQRVRSYSHSEFTNIIFLHHSVGANLIKQGDVRGRLTKAGYTFWDHDYNREGLTRPDGSRAGYSYNVPDDNTDPDGLARIFAQPVYALPLNTFSGLLQHEVIVFKSCFPTSDITSNEQLERYKAYYLNMRAVMDQHRDRLFIVVTPPPLNPAETDPGAAARARAFANWLKSDEFLSGHPNVFTFDFFNYLAENNPASPDYSMLRTDYRQGTDSHPNQLANEKVAPLLVDFVVGAVERYRETYKK